MQQRALQWLVVVFLGAALVSGHCAACPLIQIAQAAPHDCCPHPCEKHSSKPCANELLNPQVYAKPDVNLAGLQAPAMVLGPVPEVASLLPELSSPLYRDLPVAQAPSDILSLELYLRI